MARRPSGRPRGARDDYQDDEGYRPRRPRRSGGNEGLWIALVVGLLLAVVMVIVLTGGESESESQASAQAALEHLFGLCLDNNVDEGAYLVEAVEILTETTPEFSKQWVNKTDAEKADSRRQAFLMIRGRVVPTRDAKGRILAGDDLRLLNKSEIPGLFLNATYRVADAGKRVDITFDRGGYSWTAILRRTETTWILSKLIGPR